MKIVIKIVVEIVVDGIHGNENSSNVIERWDRGDVVEVVEE